MKKLNIFIISIMAFIFLSCEKQYEQLPQSKIYTDADFGTISTIRSLKDIYYDKFGTATMGQSILMEQDIVIKGKVISSDRAGNIYRSLYIQDSTGGIELKIGSGQLYNEYPQGRTLYVKVKGLTLGDYRFNLSLGYNKDANYPNSYINVQSILQTQFLKGEYGKIIEKDAKPIKDGSDFNDPYDIGRLVRVEGAKSVFGTVADDGFSSTDVFPSYLESKKDIYGNTTYNNFTFEQKKLPLTWAYAYNNEYYYGSCLFTIPNEGDDRFPQKGLIIRSSGFSRFALKELPANGQTVNITAIVNRYASSSGGFKKYQLLLNSAEDVVEVK